MGKAYKDISRFPGVSPATWKFSGGKNDKGVWRGRGTIDNRREGRTNNLELVGGERGFVGCCGLDRTSYLVPLETNDPELCNVWDVDGSLARSRSAGSAEEKQNSGSGPDRTGRPICSLGFLEGNVTRSVLLSNRYEHDPLLEGPSTSSSENGNVRAA